MSYDIGVKSASIAGLKQWLVGVSMFLLVTRAVAGPSLHTDREIVDISAPGTGQPGSVEVLPAGGARDWVAADQLGSRELGPLNTTAPSPVQTTIRTRPFIEGLLAEREGDYQRAVECFEAVLAEDPAHLQAWRRVAEAHRRLGQLELASDKLWRGLEAGRSPVEVYRELAEVYLQGDAPDSVAKYQALARGEEWVATEASTESTFPLQFDPWWVFAVLGGGVLLVAAIHGFLRLRRRLAQEDSRQQENRFTRAMRRTGDDLSLDTGEEDELDRQIQAKRDELRQGSASLLGVDEKTLSDEGLEDRHLDQVLSQLEILRKALQMQEERTRLYAEIVRLQNMKLEAMSQQLQLWRRQDKD